jgi:hypothetical protein
MPQQPNSLNQLLLLLLLLLCTSSTLSTITCPNYTPNGYFNAGTFISSMPTPTSEATFIPIPSALTICELAQLHQDCIDRINEYRAGTRKFSSGRQSIGVPVEPLIYTSGQRTICANEQTLGDLHISALNKFGCSGAHTEAWSCDGYGSWMGQNSCCSQGGGSWGDYAVINTYGEIRQRMYGCLQSMWDEGDDKNGITGHWVNMKDPNFKYVVYTLADLSVDI